MKSLSYLTKNSSTNCADEFSYYLKLLSFCENEKIYIMNYALNECILPDSLPNVELIFRK